MIAKQAEQSVAKKTVWLRKHPRREVQLFLCFPPPQKKPTSDFAYLSRKRRRAEKIAPSCPL
jgi:hypothetical protein